MADWLDAFHDDLWDALPEMDRESLERRAWRQAQEAVDLTTEIPNEKISGIQRFYDAYMRVVDDMMSNKELRAQALKEQGRG